MAHPRRSVRFGERTNNFVLAADVPIHLPSPLQQAPIIRTYSWERRLSCKGSEEGRGVMQSVPRSEDSDTFLLIGRLIEEENMCIRDTGCARSASGPRLRLLGRLLLSESCHVNCAALCAGVEREIAFTGAVVQFQPSTDRPTGRYLRRSSHHPSVTSLFFSASLALPLFHLCSLSFPISSLGHHFLPLFRFPSKCKWTCHPVLTLVPRSFIHARAFTLRLEREFLHLHRYDGME